jgi:recombination protein RecT
MSVDQQVDLIKQTFAAPSVTEKFRQLLGERAQGFLTSLLQIVGGNKQLKDVSPVSIYNAAAIAATLDLPINQNLGFAWIIPYKGQAQFQMGYKGYIQLAMRSGQYLRINVVDVYKNQFKSWNSLTEELQADFSAEGQGEIVGFCAYFKTVNGFEKFVYWPIEKVKKHANRFSKTYSKEDSVWKTDFEKMARKTVLKNMLSDWGILSIEMQKALVVDQAVLNDDEGRSLMYPDNEKEEKDEHKEKAAGALDQTGKDLKELITKSVNNENK